MRTRLLVYLAICATCGCAPNPPQPAQTKAVVRNSMGIRPEPAKSHHYNPLQDPTKPVKQAPDAPAKPDPLHPLQPMRP